MNPAMTTVQRGLAVANGFHRHQEPLAVVAAPRQPAHEDT